MAESLALAVEYLYQAREAADQLLFLRERDRLSRIEAGAEETAIGANNASGVVQLDQRRRAQTVTTRRAPTRRYPVATPVGDDWPQIEDETADPHEAALVKIRVEQLRGFIDEMEDETRRVMCLYWGVFGFDRHTQPEIARRMNLSVSQVKRRCQAGMAELRGRFGVQDD